uniref:Uncharacterized protein n=1 Tax=Anguilla anguilla TaxID=7936 RepID=A0A0E9UZK7_ANGAN
MIHQRTKYGFSIPQFSGSYLNICRIFKYIKYYLAHQIYIVFTHKKSSISLLLI